MADAPTTPLYSKGLAGVIADESSICLVDGDNGRLYYRGFPISELAAKRSFEDTAFLLLHSRLPDRAEQKAFHEKLAAYAALPDYLSDIVRVLAQKKGVKFHPMEVLQAVTALIRTRTTPDLATCQSRQ
jgi:citrate synthase